jgi:hypothetical protein
MALKKIYLPFIILCGILLAVSFSQAQVFNPTGLANVNKGITATSTNAGLQSGPKTVADLVINIVRVILTIVGLVFFILIVYGGFKWMTAAGNDQKVAEARKLIINAVIGLAIISAAYAISAFVAAALEPPAGNQPNQVQTP